MHPAEETGCKTGEDKFPRWQYLADAIDIDCATGLTDAGQVNYWISWAGVTLGDGVMRNMWKCKELFALEDGGPGCWPKEHNFQLGHDAWSAPVKRERMLVSQFHELTGQTMLTKGSKRTGNAKWAGIALQIRQLIDKRDAELNQIPKNWKYGECNAAARAGFCCAVDDADVCTEAPLGRKSCHTASTPTKCEGGGLFSSASCVCATGYCYVNGECISGPERQRSLVWGKYESALRHLKRFTQEGVPDPEWNHKWVCDERDN